MTIDEFGQVLKYLQAGSGAKPAGPEQTAVYFELLAEFSAPIVREAAKRSLIDHHYPTLPPVGAIRKLCEDLSRPAAITSAEAWTMAHRAAQRHGVGTTKRLKPGGKYPDDVFEVNHEDDALADMPPVVARVVRTFGYRLICDATAETVGIVRAQFLKVFESVSERSRREPALTGSVGGVTGQLSDAFGMPETNKTLAIASK